ncbi:MAG: type II toxin-antitoxin system VapB family antitoxin [Proteobacteria bacterium]|nr:type II toxin-antitoxin system VapB family antitoxin [Pseudomonadota bacterium]
MQIHAVIDDNLYQQAIQASGLPDTQAMLEEALRVLIASKSPPQDMAGYLNRFARHSLSFTEERELAWNGVADEHRDS